MNHPSGREPVPPHTVFLQRRAGPVSEGSFETRLGQGAFLALRLVDLLAPDRQPVHPDAFHYQHAATERYCEDLPAECAETAHLQGLVATAADAARAKDGRLVIPALFAYALHLEDRLKLGEAFDVLETLLRVGGDRVSAADAITTRLRMARVLRKLNEFDAADDLYAEAGALASRANDGHAALLSRIGAASVLWGRGNLTGAEQAYRTCLADARHARDQDAEGRAEHGVGVVLYARGQPDLAVPHLWRAFELYLDDSSRVRALSDMGVGLLAIGDAVAAERALSEAVRRGAGADHVTNAMVELMHCASYRRDRVRFASWRKQCEARVDDMPPNIRTDFYLKQGIGQARFGRFRRAEASMRRAQEIATAHGLHEFEFRIERILAGLEECEPEIAREPHAGTEPVFQTDELREVSECLAQLAG